MTAETQCELFSAVLDAIGSVDLIVNEVIEVDLESGETEFSIHRYNLPENID